MSQEIETTLDESSVTAGAKPADPMPKLGADGSSLAGVQDLGGPTPVFANIASTVSEFFNLENIFPGKSFLNQI